MNDRFEMMNSSLKYSTEKNYTYYGLKPKFIAIDELATFKAKIAGDYKTEGEFEETFITIGFERTTMWDSFNYCYTTYR
ncbi:hypothetical protein ACJZQ2_000487 [Enterococcus faecium]|nr:hypothetical protein [Enterococcus faecium]